MTKPRATWVLWAHEEWGWCPVVNIVRRGPNSAGGWAKYFKTCIELDDKNNGVIREIRILPAGRKPK